MLTEQTARELKDTCTAFNFADMELRAATNNNVVDVAIEYLDARDAHQTIIAKADAESTVEEA